MRLPTPEDPDAPMHYSLTRLYVGLAMTLGLLTVAVGVAPSPLWQVPAVAAVLAFLGVFLPPFTTAVNAAIIRRLERKGRPPL